MIVSSKKIMIDHWTSGFTLEESRYLQLDGGYQLKPSLLTFGSRQLNVICLLVFMHERDAGAARKVSP